MTERKPFVFDAKYALRVIASIALRHFKAFERIHVPFRERAVLVGPNNAGKSTVLAALRVGSNMIRIARRLTADRRAEDGGFAWSFSAGQVSLLDENLRHEFRDARTVLLLTFKSGARLEAAWPTGEQPDELEPYFTIRDENAVRLRRPAEVKRALPLVAVTPPLRPVEHNEVFLSDDHVRSNMSTRLSSSHFRNQLRLLDEARDEDSRQSDLDKFREWAEPWTPDFSIGDLTTRLTERGRELDLFCREVGSRTEKELYWAGDGVQVWLQILMHLFQARDAHIVLLDEPDLYLHADLQRRLVRVLESMDTQTIVASHSAEMLSEAAPRSVVWIDKHRRQAIVAPREERLVDLSRAIGSQFNLRLARALRAEAVLFVEGQDMRVLRNVARTLGASELDREVGLVTIPLGGYSRWDQVEPFAWLTTELLEGAIPTLVVLDRDYRSDDQVREVEERLGALGVGVHVWRRKELESYLLEPEPLARICGLAVDEASALLSELANEQRHDVLSKQLSERVRTEVSGRRHAVTVTTEFVREFEETWARAASPHHMCNAKDLLTAFNRRVTSDGHRPASVRQLSSRIRAQEVPEEMKLVIQRAERLVSEVS